MMLVICMKKKMLIVIAILLVIVVILGILYALDTYMMKNNKPVIFSTWGYDYAPPELIGDVVNIVDKTKENSEFACSMALEKIFEDGKNEYYLSCIKSKYIIVKYENGYKEDVKSALKNSSIGIDDLDRFNIDYITQEKQIQHESSFVATVLEETTTYMIVEPNENEIERKSADRIVISYGKEHKDYLYGVGSKVVISYSTGIMETYPASINTNDVSLLD